jgi:hypothetical protein
MFQHLISGSLVLASSILSRSCYRRFFFNAQHLRFLPPISDSDCSAYPRFSFPNFISASMIVAEEPLKAEWQPIVIIQSRHWASESKDYIRNCRKSPEYSFLLFPHLVKSATYKSKNASKLLVRGFFDSLYFNAHFSA